jgi:hypothetical protein
MMKNIHLLLALLIFLVSACTGSAEPTLLPNPDGSSASPAAPSVILPEVEAPAIEASEPTTVHQEVIVTDESALPGSAETLVDLAFTDLAQRLGVEISAITLISTKPIIWPDATLGCPKPGMDFSPVDIPGYIITLEGVGKRYAYHTDDENRVFLCPAEGDRPDEIFIMP